MKETYNALNKFLLIIAILVLSVLKIKAQVMPEELNKNTLNEQMNYLEEGTRIYDNFRAIREDMFQKIMTNVSDTLSLIKNKVNDFNNQTAVLNHTIDTLKTSLETTRAQLDELTNSKNSIRLLSMEMDKKVYNSIMWTIVAALVIILIIGFLLFKSNLTVTINTKKELKAFIAEFEAYRKTSQQARDKLYMDHANEMKKLRDKGI